MIALKAPNKKAPGQRGRWNELHGRNYHLTNCLSNKFFPRLRKIPRKPSNRVRFTDQVDLRRAV